MDRKVIKISPKKRQLVSACFEICFSLVFDNVPKDPPSNV